MVVVVTAVGAGACVQMVCMAVLGACVYNKMAKSSLIAIGQRGQQQQQQQVFATRPVQVLHGCLLKAASLRTVGFVTAVAGSGVGARAGRT